MPPIQPPRFTPRFLAAVEFALRPDHEGTHSNDPRDRGKETWYGIARTFYPTLSPWPPSRDQAIAIHHRDRWVPIHGDELPEGLGLLVFEAALNQGLATAVKLLQQELNNDRAPEHWIFEDGDLGPETLRAIRAVKNPAELVDCYAARRAWRYEINPQEVVYGKGWFRRLFRGHREAMTHGQ